MSYSTPLAALDTMGAVDDFRSTIDTTRPTKAVIIGADTLTVAPIKNEVTGDTINIPIGADWMPIRTQTAITVSGYTVVYCY